NLSAADLRAVYRYWYTLRVARMYDASPRNYLAAVFRENMAAHFNVTREEYFAIVDSESQAIRADYDKWVTMAKTD
ncbi:MAG: hypothetical protein RML32_11095, partial [Gammaproteobacteria bacterium]|nr:hypothetical protein [Gammaproteobacteria bacterium]